jgi:hypothetical protein
MKTVNYSDLYILLKVKINLLCNKVRDEALILKTEDVIMCCLVIDAMVWNGDEKKKDWRKDSSTLYFISCSNFLKIISEKTDKVRFGVYEKKDT